MIDRFAQKMADPQVAHDTRLLGDFADIYCAGNHADRERTQFVSDASLLGVYSRRPFVLCDECAEHVRYAERRRAYCPKEPKPFCANCDTHCYRPDERAWQQQMMRYSGPRSWRRGYALEGVRHMLETRKAKKSAARSADRA